MACTRGSGSGTRWAAAVRSAAISRSDSPWRAAMCSTICCWRMLTSVRCFSNSSMSGEEPPPVGDKTRGIRKKNKITQKKNVRLSVILHNLTEFSTSVTR